MNKKVCFTVLLGNYDTLKEPEIISEGWDYICITDQKLTSNVWKILEVNHVLDNRYFSRYIWTHYWEFINYHFYFKIDANMTLIKDLNPLLNYFKDDIDIMLSLHGDRFSIYKEAERIKYKFPESIEIVNNQINKYKIEGFPETELLHDNGVKLFKDSEKLRKFNLLWWDEISNNSWRDQLSFDYLLWKLKDSSLKLNVKSLLPKSLRNYTVITGEHL